MKIRIWVGLRKLLNKRTALSGVFLIFCLVILSPYSQIVQSDAQADDITYYEKHAERIEEMFKCGIGGVFGIFALVSAFQIINAQYVRDEITKGQKHIDEAVKESKEKITECSTKAEKNLITFSSLGHEALLKTIDLNEARIRLTREITDLDEPSIHHPVPPADQAVIAYYLEAVKTQRVI